MSSFNDARCVCGRRISWVGKMVNRPACSHCGDRPWQWQLERADREIEAQEERIFARMEAEQAAERRRLEQSGRTLRELRKRAGLTITEVAEYLGVPYATIDSWENGTDRPDESMSANLAELYGVFTGDRR